MGHATTYYPNRSSVTQPHRKLTEELDAVIALELGHLRHHHTAILLVVAIAPFFLLSWLFSLVPIAFVADHNTTFALPGAILLGGFVSRKVEHSADKAASSMIEDPEASIRMLARLTHLNMLPTRWTGWDVKAMSHPSLDERAAHIAEQFHIPPDRVIQLLQSEPAPAEHYPLPPTLKQSEWARYRHESGARNLVVYLASLALPPIAGSWLVTHTQPIVFWAAVAALTFFIGLLIPRMVMQHHLRKIEHRTRTRSGQSGGQFVGLRPALEPRLYYWHAFWDIGIVDIGGEVLGYSGEQASFQVGASDVHAVRLTASSTGWFEPKAVSFVTSNGPFSFTPIGQQTARSLLQKAQVWLAAPRANNHVELSPPAFPAISSLSPREAVLSAPMLIVLVLVGLSSWAGTAVFAPQWTFMPALISMCSMVGHQLPSIVHRPPRPYGDYGDNARAISR